MTIRSSIVLCAVAVLAMFGCTVPAMASADRAAPMPSSTGLISYKNATASIERLIPAFEDAQSAADLIPEYISRVTPLEPETSRLLGINQRGTFWVAVNKSEDICLVTQTVNGSQALPGDKPVAGISCSSSSEFRDTGIASVVDGYTAARGVAAYLLPPDVDASSARAAVEQLGSDPSGFIRRGSTNLIAVDESATATAGRIQIVRSGGGSFSLPKLPTCGVGCGDGVANSGVDTVSSGVLNPQTSAITYWNGHTTSEVTHTSNFHNMLEQEASTLTIGVELVVTIFNPPPGAQTWCLNSGLHFATCVPPHEVYAKAQCWWRPATSPPSSANPLITCKYKY